MMRLDAMRVGDSAQEKVGPNDATLRSRMAGLGKALAIAVAASVNGAGVIIMVAISPVVGIAVIVAFIIFGILLPAVMIRRRDTSRPKSAIAEVAQPSAGDADPPVALLTSEDFASGGAVGSLVVALARNRLVLLPVIAIVTAVAIVFALKLEATLDVKDFFDSKADFVVSLDKLDEHVGERGGEPALVYIRGDLTDPGALAAMQRLLERMKANPYVAKDIDGELTQNATLFTLLSRITSTEFAISQVRGATGVEIIDADGDGIPDTQSQVKAAYDYMVQFGVPLGAQTLAYEPSLVRQILFHDSTGVEEDVTVIEAQIPGTREQAVVAAARASLEEDIAVLDDATSISLVGLTGSPFTQQETLDATTRVLTLALPIAAVLVLLALVATMGSVRYAIVTILPIGLVVAWLYGTMYLVGISLNFVTAIIAAVSIGVGIDYSIHMTERFREELARVGERYQALRRAANGTGIALIASAASSIVGFAIMGFAPMPVFSSYGILTAIMIFLAASASLVVLPSLLVLVTPPMQQRAQTQQEEGQRITSRTER